jgi:hypothetical protein
MAQSITYHEYWAEISSIATDLHEKYNRQEILHDMIDSHPWIIYTHKAQIVGLHTKNGDAILDVLEDPKPHGSMDRIYRMVAYFAMMADVNDALGDM